jgi:aerobic carbon-monoxide dehydrogenase small subunit
VTEQPEQLYDVVLSVNGVPRPARVPARRLLSDCLRHDLRLTGTHVGCEHGVCGACTVLVDGRPMRSCLMLAVSAEGAEITTVEGLGTPEDMHPVQQAFRECHGLQCGFCTPGFLTTIAAFIEDNPEPTEEEAREAISGNLCRCTGYQNIVKATVRAAELRRARRTGDFGSSGDPDGSPNAPVEGQP